MKKGIDKNFHFGGVSSTYYYKSSENQIEKNKYTKFMHKVKCKIHGIFKVYYNAFNKVYIIISYKYRMIYRGKILSCVAAFVNKKPRDIVY